MTETYKNRTESLIQPDSWKISHTNPEETGVRLFSVEHPEPEKIPTKVWIAEPNQTIDIPSTTAWAGARTSRSQDEFEDIFKEIFEATRESPEFAAKKIAKFFEKYGHASVADMAQIFLFINKIPIHLAFEIFYHVSVGAGQESSTRYITFDNLGIDSPDLLFPMEDIASEKADDIRMRWEMLQQRMGENYQKWYGLVRDAYINKFGSDISENTLNSRSLDIARLCIPAGATTSMALLMSARDWVRMIRILRETDDVRSKSLGEQIIKTLQLSDSDEAKDIKLSLGTLLKYNEPTYTIPQNKADLKDLLIQDKNFLKLLKQAEFREENLFTGSMATSLNKIDVDPGEGIALQYVQELFPQLDEFSIVNYLRGLPAGKKIQIGGLIMNSHDQYNQLTNKGDIRGRSIFSVTTAMAYLRDLNRHRALGRFTPLFATENLRALINPGFNLNYQILETNGLKHLTNEWLADSRALYTEISDLCSIIQEQFPEDNGRWILRLLPLGHKVTMHLSGPITQFNYFIAQRENRPGDYGYIDIAHKILASFRGEPFLTEMLPDRKPVDLDSKEEFAKRT